MRSSPDSLPLVINSSQVHLFNFYQDGMVNQGMRYGTDLYGKAYTFATQDRLLAFDFATQLAATGTQTVITVSPQEYRVWVHLQADEYPHWRAMIKGFLNPLLECGVFAPA